MTNPGIPVVLIFAGTDSSGGAGMAADIQTVSSLGGYPALVVTAVTAQDTSSVKQFSIIEPELVVAQARAVLEDLPVAAIKTGMLGDTATITAVASIVAEYRHIPLVVDPVLASNTGDSLIDVPIEEAIRVMLAPHAQVMTPNGPEARRLAPNADTLEACAHEIMSCGAAHVLVTGGHEGGERVVNRLFGGNRHLDDITCPRIPGNFHGSGCTLASAVATNLAHGLPVPAAVSGAVDFTYKSIKHGYRPGMGQLVPDRLFWSRHVDVPGRPE